MNARRLLGMAGAAVAALLLVGTLAPARDGEGVGPAKIPKKVMDALKARFPKAKIRKSTKEKEGGVVVYDVEFKQDGRKYEADIKEDGSFVNYEKEIAARDLPEAVRKAVRKRYPKAKVKEVMQITQIKGKAERLEGYEVVLATAEKKKVEVTAAPDGKILEDSQDEKEE